MSNLIYCTNTLKIQFFNCWQVTPLYFRLYWIQSTFIRKPRAMCNVHGCTTAETSPKMLAKIVKPERHAQNLWHIQIFAPEKKLKANIIVQKHAKSSNWTFFLMKRKSMSIVLLLLCGDEWLRMEVYVWRSDTDDSQKA